MDITWANKWADALESGEYIQGRGSLRQSFKRPDGSQGKRHCCLGVLSDIVLKECPEVGHWNDDTFSTRASWRDGFIAWGSYLPDGVAELVGIATKHDPSPILDFSEDAQYRSAIDLNDGKGATFAEIAALIRQNADKI